MRRALFALCRWFCAGFWFLAIESWAEGIDLDGRASRAVQWKHVRHNVILRVKQKTGIARKMLTDTKFQNRDSLFWSSKKLTYSVRKTSMKGIFSSEVFCIGISSIILKTSF